MQLSPLILKQYFLTNIAVKCNVPNVPTQEDLVKLMAATTSNITSQIETAKHEENDRQWRVVLRLIVRASEENGYCPYEIDIELLGFFEVHESVDESAIQDLVACNGPAVLCGAAREILLLITGRGPLPPFTLPSTTFIDGSQENRKKAALAAAARK